MNDAATLPSVRQSSRIASALLPTALLVALVFGMPALQPLFHALFPALDRPIYTRASFLTLTLWHVGLVLAATVPVVIAGVARRHLRHPPERPRIRRHPRYRHRHRPDLSAGCRARHRRAAGRLWCRAHRRGAHRLWHPAGGRQHHRGLARRVTRGAGRRRRHGAHAPAEAPVGGAAACRAGDPGRRAHIGDHQHRHRGDWLDRRRSQPRLADHRGPVGIEYRLCHPGRVVVGLLAIATDQLFALADARLSRAIGRS